MQDIKKDFEGIDLPKLVQVQSSRNTYTKILPNGEREEVVLEKGDRQRRTRSWPKKLGKHAGKDMFKSNANWNKSLDQEALQEVMRDETYQELTQFIKSIKIEVEE